MDQDGIAKQTGAERRTGVALLLLGALVCAPLTAAVLDVSRAVVVVRPGELPAAEKTAAAVLLEEMERRSGVRLQVDSHWPATGPVVAVTSTRNVPGWGRQIPETTARSEGFRLWVDGSVVWVVGADARGALYGVGHLLRQLNWAKGKLELPASLDVTTSPMSSIRGHQLGFRATANSWDAWTVTQFERYIRELALFGINAVENIPFGDEGKNPVVKVPKREMNRAIAEICRRYGLDYWVWTPVSLDLNDKQRAARLLEHFSEVFSESPTLTGVFVPGGDPGHNPPELLLPYLEEIAKRLRPVHPKAKVWLSMQGFSAAKTEVVYNWLGREVPAWFGGIVAGPSSPPVEETRRLLPAGVKLRLYPDVTHNKLSQYEVPEWDQAYALTLGREAVNPRPVEYAAIHNRYAALSDGFISYSDGVHDDVNKIVWSALGWDSGRDVRDIVIEYCRVYFSPAVAEEAADAILALERNWRGSLAANGGVEATLRWWQDLRGKESGPGGELALADVPVAGELRCLCAPAAIAGYEAGTGGQWVDVARRRVGLRDGDEGRWRGAEPGCEVAGGRGIACADCRVVRAFVAIDCFANQRRQISGQWSRARRRP